MCKLPLVIVVSSFFLSACVSNIYSNPRDLLFQKTSSDSTQIINVKRDYFLCAQDTVDDQNCPINFYIDNIKAGSFFINNSAKFNLKSDVYNFKVKNCTTECVTCDFDISIDSSANLNFLLSIDSKGHPIITNDEKVLMCSDTPSSIEPAQVEKTTNIDLSADTLFKFNGSALSDLLPKGHQEVLVVADKIKNGYISVSKINLVGHTDRLGTDSYNKNLGQDRANTVKDILLKNGVPANLISSVSIGKDQPITNGCYEVVSREKLQACLQPDRRVVVEITGISK